jgi:hypothetical protein
MGQSIHLTNLQEKATGTTTGDKHALDVNIASGSLTMTEEAVVADGGALPSKVKVVGGYDGANVQAVKTSSDGTVAVSDATAQASLSSVDGKLGSLGQKTMAGSAPVVLASDQSSIPVTDNGSTLSVDDGGGSLTVDGTVAISGAVPVTDNGSTLSIDDGAGSITVDGTVAISGTVAVTDNAGSLTVDDGGLTLSVDDGGGALTVDGTVAATQSGNWSTRTQDGSGNALTSAAVGSNRGLHSKALGHSAVDKARRDYSSGNVSTAAYTQLIASTAAECQEVEIFDSSGQTLVLATGAAASEADQIYVVPGGNGRVPLRIASGTRVSIKAVSGTASTGEVVINLYG